MGRYDRYILAQLVALFGFFSLILISVYWVNGAVDLFDRLIEDGQNFIVFLEFSALGLPKLMLIVLPVSAFVATLFAFNRLIGESELVVLQTSGLSALRLMRPVFYFGLIVATLIAIIAHAMAPAAQTRLAERNDEVRNDLATQVLREGEFIHPGDGLTVYIREIDDNGELQDVFLHDRSDPASETSYLAPTAVLVAAETGPRLVMFEGMAQTLDYESARLSVVRFQDFTYDVGAALQRDGARGVETQELPTMMLLTADEAVAESLGLPLAEMLFSGHDRFARALFVLFPPLIGAACLMLGNFSRFGVWPQILLAVMIVIPLQAVLNGAEAAATQDPDLFFLAYAQPMIAAAIVVVLTALALIGRSQLLGWRRAS